MGGLTREIAYAFPLCVWLEVSRVDSEFVHEELHELDVPELGGLVHACVTHFVGRPHLAGVVGVVRCARVGKTRERQVRTRTLAEESGGEGGGEKGGRGGQTHKHTTRRFRRTHCLHSLERERERGMGGGGARGLRPSDFDTHRHALADQPARSGDVSAHSHPVRGITAVVVNVV